jgi:hypothetical protein
MRRVLLYPGRGNLLSGRSTGAIPIKGWNHSRRIYVELRLMFDVAEITTDGIWKCARAFLARRAC